MAAVIALGGHQLEQHVETHKRLVVVFDALMAADVPCGTKHFGLLVDQQSGTSANEVD